MAANILLVEDDADTARALSRALENSGYRVTAVDTGTESRILAHLREERSSRSAIIVSHRLSAVADADEIVVLRNGVITERGTHDALVERDGWYAVQWRYQQIEESLENA